jgi:bifunctional non-homologous end joining protein LigD
MLIERMPKRLAADTKFIEPYLPSPADRPPSGSNWIHEIKHDGYRLNLKVFSPKFTEQIIAEHPACPSL